MKRFTPSMVMAASVGLCSAVVAPSAVSSASPVATCPPIVLYVGHGVEVISSPNSSTGCDRVYLTSNFTKWRYVTPPLKPKSIACNYVWASAAFVSPKIGWLLARNEGGTGTVLEHTVNGGRTWVQQPGGGTGSAGGSELIGFANASLGWRQQFASGSNAQFVLQITVNGGATWTPVYRTNEFSNGCQWSPDVFASKRVGFADNQISGATTSGELAPFEWRTLDGGVTWTKMWLPRPASIVGSSPGIYGQPSFWGNKGALPVVFAVHGHQEVVVYTTIDAGLHWTVPIGPGSSLAINGDLHPNVLDSRAGCNAFMTVTSASLVSVDVVSPTIWWVIRPGRKGDTEIVIVNHGAQGANFSTYITVELPDTTYGAMLQATNAAHALLTVQSANGLQAVYSTADRGVTWVKLLPPASGSSSFITPSSKPPF